MEEITSADIGVGILVDHGCTVVQIRDLSAGVELLWSKPKPLPPQLGPTGDASKDFFRDSVFIGGWFPMYPMAGAPEGRSELRQHGDAPRVAWKVTQHSINSLTAGVHLADGSSLVRSHEVRGRRVQVASQARNDSDREQWVTAGEHPCFDVNGLGIQTIDLGAGPVPIEKFGSHTVEEGTGLAVLKRRSPAEPITLRWDAATLPGVLIWNELSGVVGVEPKSFRGRTATDAAGAWWRLSPGSSVEWELSIALGDEEIP